MSKRCARKNAKRKAKIKRSRQQQRQDPKLGRLRKNKAKKRNRLYSKA